MNKRIVIFFVFSLAIASCAPQAAAQEQKATPEAGALEETGPPASVNLADIDSVPEASEGENIVIPAPRERSSEGKLIHFVSLDLSKRLGLDLGAVTLVESLPVSWADAGLGCPAEGMSYAQSKVDGYKITLEVQGKEYFYHSSGLETFIWCDGGVPMAPLD